MPELVRRTEQKGTGDVPVSRLLRSGGGDNSNMRLLQRQMSSQSYFNQYRLSNSGLSMFVHLIMHFRSLEI